MKSWNKLALIMILFWSIDKTFRLYLNLIKLNEKNYKEKSQKRKSENYPFFLSLVWFKEKMKEK